ncbi:MAG: AAA family ATPase [Pirellulales bacterium]
MVDAAVNLGLVATTSMHGAMSPEKTDWTPLAGKDVVILPDHDQPGRQYAQTVAEILVKLNPPATLRIVQLPGLPEHGDIVEWIEAHGDAAEPASMAAEIEAMAAAAPLWRPGSTIEAIEPANGTADTTAHRLSVIPSGVFFATDYGQRYLVTNILVAGQPAILGGKSKVLKTSLALDLAISVGTGGRFLGEFQAAPGRVLVLSGESGEFTIQETARRICRAKGVEPADVDALWGFTLPRIALAEDLAILTDLISKHQVSLAIVDPAYLTMMRGTSGLQASNLFDTGPILLGLADVGVATGSTILLLHHARKNDAGGRPFDVPELPDLAMAGFAEFARQWLLVGRREAYTQGSGLHRLWLNCGGSSGHSGLWSVDVDEGQFIDDRFHGRQWDVQVSRVADARAEAKAEREQHKAADMERRDGEHRSRLLSALRQCPAGETKKTLRSISGLNEENFAKAIRTLLQEGRAKICQVQKGKNTYDGFGPTENSQGGQGGQGGQNETCLPCPGRDGQGSY